MINSNTTIPLSVAALGISTFALMDALMKGLSIEMGAYNAMLWRTLIGLLLASILFVGTRQVWPAAANIRFHVLRGVLTSIMAFLFFWGLVYVPLAEAIALTFIAPLIALYLAAVLLDETIGTKSVWASAIGMIGALIIIGGKLGGEYSDNLGKGIAAILISALLYAYNLILQRQQALIAKPIEITFFQNASVVACYLLVAPFLAVVPSVEIISNLLAAAILGVVSALLLSWAYARAEAKVLIPVEYTAFIWAALLGWLFFQESVSVATLLGTALIVTACLIAAWQHPERVEHIEVEQL